MYQSFTANFIMSKYSMTDKEDEKFQPFKTSNSNNNILKGPNSKKSTFIYVYPSNTEDGI